MPSTVLRIWAKLVFRLMSKGRIMQGMEFLGGNGYQDQLACAGQAQPPQLCHCAACPLGFGSTQGCRDVCHCTEK
jgi:hypothetical protein